MKFVPEVEFSTGLLRPLREDDLPTIVKIYQKSMPAGQSQEAIEEQAKRLLNLAVQMAATQRGLMWAIESEDVMQGMLSLYDWQPTTLKTLMKLDALESLSVDCQVQCIEAAIEFLQGKFHLRNFSYQWVENDGEGVKDVFIQAGFTQQAVLRDGRRTGQDSYIDVTLMSRILETE